MVRHPLEHGVAEDQVEGRRRRPVVDVGDREVGGGQPLPRRRDHLRRRIDADDLRLRIARGEQFGRVARPAADIEDAARPLDRDPREQFRRRPRPLVLELEVLARRPLRHHPLLPFRRDDLQSRAAKVSAIGLRTRPPHHHPVRDPPWPRPTPRPPGARTALDPWPRGRRRASICGFLAVIQSTGFGLFVLGGSAHALAPSPSAWRSSRRPRRRSSRSSPARCPARCRSRRPCRSRPCPGLRPLSSPSPAATPAAPPRPRPSSPSPRSPASPSASPPSASAPSAGGASCASCPTR